MTDLKLTGNEPELIKQIQLKLSKHKKQVFSYYNGEIKRNITRVKQAAVLIPVYFKGNDAYLLFTKRTDLVAHHKGEISFPGGFYEKNDTNLKETALRETEEELGLKARDILILGEIDQYLTRSRFLVKPFVGYFAYPYQFKINEPEISQVIEIPLKILLDINLFEIKKIKGFKRPLHYYYYHHQVIWGITGFILSNFLTIVFDLKDRQGINDAKW